MVGTRGKKVDVVELLKSPIRRSHKKADTSGSEPSRAKTKTAETRRAEVRKAETSKTEPIKAETGRLKSVRKAGVSKAEANKTETSQIQTNILERSRVETKKAETSNSEGRKAEASRGETSRAEVEKAETSRAKTNKAETSRAEVKKTEAQKSETPLTTRSQSSSRNKGVLPEKSGNLPVQSKGKALTEKASSTPKCSIAAPQTDSKSTPEECDASSSSDSLSRPSTRSKSPKTPVPTLKRNQASSKKVTTKSPEIKAVGEKNQVPEQVDLPKEEITDNKPDCKLAKTAEEPKTTSPQTAQEIPPSEELLSVKKLDEQEKGQTNSKSTTNAETKQSQKPPLQESGKRPHSPDPDSAEPPSKKPAKKADVENSTDYETLDQTNETAQMEVEVVTTSEVSIPDIQQPGNYIMIAPDNCDEKQEFTVSEVLEIVEASEDGTDHREAEYVVLNQVSPRQTETTLPEMNSLDVLVQVAARDENQTAVTNLVSGELSQQREQTNEATQPQGTLRLEVFVPHPSIRLADDSRPLEVCSDLDCGCQLVHCPLCSPGKIGVSSLKTMTRHFGIHRKRGTNYGDYHIYLCMLSCAGVDDDEPHLHCPMCGTTVPAGSHRLSVFLRHLTDCEQKVQRGTGGTLGYQGSSVVQLQNDQNSKEFLPSSLLVPHPSIIRQTEELSVETCSPGNGCHCGMYHCPLCQVDQQTFKYHSKALIHLKSHMKHAVDFQEYRILICQLSCAILSHYHCPMCGYTFRRKVDLTKHIQKSCRGLYKRRKHRNLSSTVPMEFDPIAERSRVSENIKPSYYAKVKQEGADPGTSGEQGPGLSGKVDLEQVPYPHYSIVPKDVLLEPYLCGEDVPECQCDNYHCPLCPMDRVKWTRSRVRDHIHTHYRRGLAYKGHMVLSCSSDTCLKDRPIGSHYHCPSCGVIIILYENFVMHLSHGCKLKYSYTRVLPADMASSSQPRRKQSKDRKVKPRSSRRLSKRQATGSHGDTPVKAEKETAVTSDGADVDTTHEIQPEQTKAPTESTPKADNTKIVPSRPAQILQSVTASVSRELLSGVAVVTPDRLLTLLQEHCQVRWSVVGDDDSAFTLSGDWGQLERASQLLTRLLAAKLGSEQELVEYIKSYLKAEESKNQPVVLLMDAEDDTPTVQDSCPEPTPAEDPGPAYASPDPALGDIATEIASVEVATEVHPDSTAALSDETIRLMMSSTTGNEVFSNPVNCPTCRRTFHKFHVLLQHLISCTKCWVGKTLSPTFTTIINCIKSTDNLQCPTCKRKFLQQVHCVYHILRNTCSKNWLRQKLREYDIKINPLASMYSCPKCLYCTKSMMSVVNHFEVRHMDRGINCTWSNCTKVFGSQQSLDQHINRAHINQVEKVQCSVCQLLVTVKGIKNHFLSKHCDHVKLPQHRCPHCVYKNWNPLNLRNHMQNMHKERTFACTMCDKTFGRKAKLTQHYNFVHLKLKTYQSANQREAVACPTCSLVVYRKNLYRHIRTIHDKVKQFSCDKCDKTFTNKRARWTHSLTHLVDSNNDRMFLYRCAVCLKGFNRKWWFTEHVQYAHAGPQKFICNICSKSFRFKVLYQRHMIAHDSSSTQCDICLEVFVSTRQLRNHLRLKHHSKGIVSCPCGLSFISIAGFKAHEGICAKAKEMRNSLQTGESSIGEAEEGEEEGEVNVETMLVSDGIQYDTCVVDEGGATTALQDLEAAETLESISLVVPSHENNIISISPNEQSDDPDQQQVIITTEDGQVLMTTNSASSGDLLLKGEDGEDIVVSTTAGTPAAGDLGHSEQSVMTLQTDTGEQVTVLVPRGHELSEEDTKNILLEMKQSKTEEDQYVMEVSDETAVKTEELMSGTEEEEAMESVVVEENSRLSDGPGYMCGMCSEIFHSLAEVELHINSMHSHEIPTDFV